jgi:preprotein translocase subunit SecY
MHSTPTKLFLLMAWLCLNSSTMFVEDLFMLKAQWSCSVPCKEGEALKKALDEFEEGLKMGCHCVHYFVFWVCSLCIFLSHFYLPIASGNSTEAQEMHKVYNFSHKVDNCIH